MRWAALAAGILSLALGLLGFVLPYPKVPFLIIAFWSFERSSPKLHQWIMMRFRKYLRRKDLSVADKVRGAFFLIVPTLVGSVIAAQAEYLPLLIFEIAALAFGVGYSTLLILSPTKQKE